MYVCMYVERICINEGMYVCMYVCMYVERICINEGMYVCMYVCMYVYNNVDEHRTKNVSGSAERSHRMSHRAFVNSIRSSFLSAEERATRGCTLQ